MNIIEKLKSHTRRIGGALEELFHRIRVYAGLDVRDRVGKATAGSRSRHGVSTCGFHFLITVLCFIITRVQQVRNVVGQLGPSERSGSSHGALVLFLSASLTFLARGRDRFGRLLVHDQVGARDGPLILRLVIDLDYVGQRTVAVGVSQWIRLAVRQVGKHDALVVVRDETTLVHVH